MPARINRAEFLQGLESVQAGLSPRELVDQSNSYVFRKGWVVTFNSEVACRWKSGLPKEFLGAVQADPLRKLLSRIPDEDVGLFATDGELVVSGRKKRAGVAMDAKILLPLDGLEAPDGWDKLHEDFSEAVSVAKDCAGSDERKFVLTCVRLHPKWVEATDNYQAVRFRMPTGVSEPTMVRASAIKHVVDLGMTEVSTVENWVHFRNPAGLTLSVRRHAEEYKGDLKPFFEAGGGHKAVFPKGLAESAETAEIFSGENADNNVVTVRLKAGALQVKGRGVSGWYAENRKVSYAGPDVTFLISPKVLGKIAQRYNECVVARDRIVVRSGPFSYMSVLGDPNESAADESAAEGGGNGQAE